MLFEYNQNNETQDCLSLRIQNNQGFTVAVI